MCKIQNEPRLIHIKGKRYPISVISEEQQMVISQQINARTQQLRQKWGEFDEIAIITKPELAKCKHEMSEYHKKWTSSFSNNFKCPAFIKRFLHR